jgi:hypothetical protein
MSLLPIWSSKMWAHIYQTTLCHNPQDHNMNVQ